MKRALVISLFGILLSASTVARPGEIERTMAEELMVLTNVEANLATMRDQFAKVMEAQLDTMHVTDEEKTRLAEHTRKLWDLVFEELSWRSMKDQYIDLYVTVFTQEELGGLIAFYRSPAGQAFIRKMPELMKQSMEIAQVRMQRLGPRIQSMIEDLSSETEPPETRKSDPE